MQLPCGRAKRRVAPKLWGPRATMAGQRLRDSILARLWGNANTLRSFPLGLEYGHAYLVSTGVQLGRMARSYDIRTEPGQYKGLSS